MSERVLTQYRFICAFTGQLVVTGLALTLAKYFGGGNKAMGYQHTLILFGCLSVVFFFITFMTTKERVKPSKSLEGSVGGDLGNLFKNRPWIILAIVGIVSFVMFAMQNAAIAFTISNITSAKRTAFSCSMSSARLP